MNMVTMLTYYLTFTDTGVPCDGEEYANLADARDVAFEWSREFGQEVRILECFGASENLVETVLA
jgi:hypothetical protein